LQPKIDVYSAYHENRSGTFPPAKSIFVGVSLLSKAIFPSVIFCDYIIAPSRILKITKSIQIQHFQQYLFLEIFGWVFRIMIFDEENLSRESIWYLSKKN